MVRVAALVTASRISIKIITMISLEKKAKKMNIENNINYSENFRYPIEDGEEIELMIY